MSSTPPLVELNDFINLDRYPIHEPDSAAARDVIASAHDMMIRDTLVVFPEFLRPPAVSALADEQNALEPEANKLDYPCTAYGWMHNDGFPDDHPRSALLPRNCGVITTNQLAKDGYTRRLFEFNELTNFVRLMLGYETLYRSVCETLSIQINTMREGDQFGWHFDTNDGVVSFTIQNADHGGGFEYAPLIREETAENYPGVARIFSGEDKPRQPTMTPGTLSLFLGRRSLHRVAPVGPTQKPRLSLLYSYDRKPGMVFPPSSCERFLRPSPEPYRGVPHN